jgi:hypothetical protein
VTTMISFFITGTEQGVIYPWSSSGRGGYWGHSYWSGWAYSGKYERHSNSSVEHCKGSSPWVDLDVS